MNNLKTLLTISFITSILCFGTVKAQSDGGQQHVTIKAVEYFSSSSKMAIIDNNGNVTTKKLEKIERKKEFESNVSNAVIIRNEINIWTQKGYKIISYDVSVPNASYFFTTIILTKD